MALLWSKIQRIKLNACQNTELPQTQKNCTSLKSCSCNVICEVLYCWNGTAGFHIMHRCFIYTNQVLKNLMPLYINGQKHKDNNCKDISNDFDRISLIYRKHNPKLYCADILSQKQSPISKGFFWHIQWRSENFCNEFCIFHFMKKSEKAYKEKAFEIKVVRGDIWT